MSPSPSSSVDAPRSPTSPFLHNLSQRFRKGSSASRTSSLSSETTHSAADAPIHAQDAKSTKQYLLSILRDDWEYPTSQAHKNGLKSPREPASYRFRDASVSEYESGGEKRPACSSSPQYKFEHPDDVGAVIERRKARRIRLLEQEMTWNEGLRIWTLRRDAWVGAVRHKPQPQPASPNTNKRASRLSGYRTSLESMARSSSSAPSCSLPHESAAQVESTDSVEAAEPTVVDELQNEMEDGPYLPIYPPLLPASHALRSRIKPSAYPTIYSKVVLQGLAPNVPIPLSHMVGALVEGWKSEGNWPPQPTEPPKPITRSKAKNDDSAFQKWKREQEEKKRHATIRAQDVQWEQEDQHKGMRRTISGAVKKALGIGGNEQDHVDRDLERMGLTFETDEDAYAEAMDILRQEGA